MATIILQQAETTTIDIELSEILPDGANLYYAISDSYNILVSGKLYGDNGNPNRISQPDGDDRRHFQAALSGEDTKNLSRCFLEIAYTVNDNETVSIGNEPVVLDFRPNKIKNIL